jgi:hypothetical protein
MMTIGEVLTRFLKGKKIKTNRIGPPWELVIDEVRIDVDGAMILYDDKGGLLKTKAGQFDFNFVGEPESASASASVKPVPSKPIEPEKSKAPESERTERMIFGLSVSEPKKPTEKPTEKPSDKSDKKKG